MNKLDINQSDKLSIRKYYKEQRNMLSEEVLKNISEKITKLFFDHFSLDKVSSIHIFLTISKLKEISTWEIIKKFDTQYPNIKIITSVCDFKTCEIQTVWLSPQTSIFLNDWGIPEPEEKKYFPENEIDIAIIPLLAFDETGNRVGYGKGFYDRFLAKCNPKMLKIGVSAYLPVAQITDIEPTDQKMDFCITAEKIYTF
jgi:5-formyltetrahydrofolate cyclo-ligase